MASQSEGIRKLLDAEKKAAEKVSEARRKKARRLKQAKEEAIIEIEKFRKERLDAFSAYEKKHMGSKDDEQVKIEQETRTRLDAMHKKVAGTKDKVIQDLLDMVICNVEPSLHRNLKS
ncbi:V-type proton ATPase subunit G-like [Panonychus citri]|uniref:V-type proton ATPase subunit G-like n=1 Tax=Panonychus citri TaxID=50023 RepID=UPI002307C21C|nr:V-type proton ATPase subunit G-like [Panonychus citri]